MNEKESILDEFTQVTGFHRKHAIRVLNGEACKVATGGNRGTRSRIYGEAVREALIVVCEAADRICGKRLKQIIAVLVAAMQRHGHLKLDVEIQRRLLANECSHDGSDAQGGPRGKPRGSAQVGGHSVLRNSIAVRTFADWNDPQPGFFEMDFVAHCGKSVAGRHVYSLVLTDIASGWTEAAECIEESEGGIPV